MASNNDMTIDAHGASPPSPVAGELSDFMMRFVNHYNTANEQTISLETLAERNSPTAGVLVNHPQMRTKSNWTLSQEEMLRAFHTGYDLPYIFINARNAYLSVRRDVKRIEEKLVSQRDKVMREMQILQALELEARGPLHEDGKRVCEWYEVAEEQKRLCSK